MTEDEARDWVIANYGAARLAMLEQYVDLLVAESARQNLIAHSTLGTIWSRHIVDSAQLLPLADGRSGMWIDIGSGAGLPGIVIAILRDDAILLTEPRKRRADFLAGCLTNLKLPHAMVRSCRVEVIKEQASVISARAVGAIEQIFTSASECTDREALWLLPRGTSGAEELAHAKKSWHGAFHVEQSLTHPQSQIIVARGVTRR